MDSQTEGNKRNNMAVEQDQGSGISGVSINELNTRINSVTQDRWQRALQTDQFEVAESALGEVSALRSWRQARDSSSFPSFYQLAEAATTLNRAGASDIERAMVVEQLTTQACTLSPRVRDLYMGLLSKIDGSVYVPPQEFSDVTAAQLSDLESSGDLQTLFAPGTSWDVKLNRIQARIEGRLRGRKYQDRMDKEAQEFQKEEREFPTTPPSERDESKPSMDEMQRLKEGEQAPAIWAITPAYGGYYKEQSFDTWDANTNTWRQSDYRYEVGRFVNKGLFDQGNLVALNKDEYVIISAHVPANCRVRIPIPYTYTFNAADSGLGIKDKNGDFVFTNERGGILKILLIKDKSKTIVDAPPTELLTMPATFTEETEQKLKDVVSNRKGNIAKARALASYTLRRLEYSNDSSLNSVYDNDPDGYAGAIDKFKKADCDVANTYFATLCSKLGIPVRHVVGHMVKGKDKEGNARITSGTGHAWTEVWDEQNQVWVRMDATPPGDPQMEEQEKGEGIPGDYGEQEAIGPTDEQLQALEEKLKTLAEELSYTQEERQLANATGVELKQARQIIKEIQEAEETRLPNGERVVDVMSQLWSLITQSRTTTSPDYTGPLRKREGGEEIEDIVAHKIGIRGGDPDPASRQIETQQQFTERVISEMQLFMIGDKSGSMGQTVDGETKWRLQRKAMYLILSSFDRAQKNLQRATPLMINPLAVQTEVISFRDGATIDIDKPLSSNFSLEDKVKLWKSLGNQGSGNGDVPALKQLYEDIQKQREQLEQQGKEDNALRVVIACSDGEPDSPGGVHQMVDSLGQLNTVVVGVGMTETAAKVPLIFTTEHSKGDLARDINDLPAIVAKHAVAQAIKLFPEKSRQGYQKAIDAILAKFNNVGMKAVT